MTLRNDSFSKTSKNEFTHNKTNKGITSQYIMFPYSLCGLASYSFSLTQEVSLFSTRICKVSAFIREFRKVGRLIVLDGRYLSTWESSPLWNSGMVMWIKNVADVGELHKGETGELKKKNHTQQCFDSVFLPFSDSLKSNPFNISFE